MLTFKNFIIESQILSEENRNEADAMGKANEIRIAAGLNHVAEHPEVLNMDDKELEDHWNKHKDDFHEKHLPQHYRDKDKKSPADVYNETTAHLSDDQHLQNFKNTIDHIKHTHKHLKSEGFDPSTIHNVVWTSQAGDIGRHLGRESNPETDDSDIMYHAKHKDGTVKPIGQSLKIGTVKNPNLKNKTVHTLMDNFNGIDDQINSAKEKIKGHVDEHMRNLYNLGLAGKNKKGEIVLGKSYHTRYKNSVGGGQFGAGGKLIKVKREYSQEDFENIGRPAHESSQKDLKGHAQAMHGIYNAVLSQPNGHHQMTNHVRSIIGQKPADFYNFRSFMNLNKQGGVAGNHVENHIKNNEKLLSAVDHYSVPNPTTQVVKIHAHDKNGNHLFTIEQTHKKGDTPVSSNVAVHSMKITEHGRKAINS